MMAYISYVNKLSTFTPTILYKYLKLLLQLITKYIFFIKNDALIIEKALL